MDPDQTASTGAVRSGFTLFIYEASNMLCTDSLLQQRLYETLDSLKQ